MADRLPVRLAGRIVGELDAHGRLHWDSGWPDLAPLNSPALSLSLPFGEPSLDTGPFFGGLLPEGIGLERLAREIRVASNDLFGMLREVGADVGGAVTVGEPRPAVDPIVIEEDEYEAILRRAAGYIRGSAVGGGGSSATGVQPKIALTWDPPSGRWMIGRGSTPSTHLLKPVPNEHSARVLAEAHLNAVARSLGLSSHEARIESAGDQTVLVVERYDRVRDENGLHRIHQEDAAQAIGLPWGGNDKYESVDARASLRSIAKLLPNPAFTTAPTDRERLLALTVLNVAAGNTDAHAKNFSVLLPDLADAHDPHAGRICLADAYDLVPQVLFDAESAPLALRVNSRSLPSEITAEDLIAEGVSWGITRGRAEGVVVSSLRDILEASELPDGSAGVSALLQEQAGNLLRGDRAWTRPLPPAIALSAK